MIRQKIPSEINILKVLFPTVSVLIFFLIFFSIRNVPEAEYLNKSSPPNLVRERCDKKFSDYAIYEHCLPFNVSRAFDEARGIYHPRIWTDKRDLNMWDELQS